MENQDEIYFYAAEHEAAIYDMVVECTQPDYAQMHSAMLETVVWHLGGDSQAAVLDLGCGTGREALAILLALPGVHVTAVDFSAPMIARLEENLRTLQRDSAAARCRTVLADFTAPSVLTGKLRSSGDGYGAVISAGSLHHYRPDEKLQLYRDALAVLAPGGIFVNADLFSYADPALAAQARSHMENWLIQQFRDPQAEHWAAAAVFGEHKEERLKIWLHHFREHNIPLPVESADNACTVTEFSLLRAAGFEAVACPYRYWMGGVVCARKPSRKTSVNAPAGEGWKSCS